MSLIHQSTGDIWFLKHICSPRGKVWEKIGTGTIEIRDNIPEIPMNPDGTITLDVQWSLPLDSSSSPQTGE